MHIKDIYKIAKSQIQYRLKQQITQLLIYSITFHTTIRQLLHFLNARDYFVQKIPKTHNKHILEIASSQIQ